MHVNLAEIEACHGCGAVIAGLSNFNDHVETCSKVPKFLLGPVVTQ